MCTWKPREKKHGKNAELWISLREIYGSAICFAHGLESPASTFMLKKSYFENVEQSHNFQKRDFPKIRISFSALQIGYFCCCRFCTSWRKMTGCIFWGRRLRFIAKTHRRAKQQTKIKRLQKLKKHKKHKNDKQPVKVFAG